MHKSKIAFLILFILLITTVVFGEQTKVNSFSIDLPEGFEGPITQSSGPLEIMAFTKPHKGQVTASLIQFSVINIKEAPSDTGLQSATVTNKEYLMKMLGGIERSRSNFWKGNYREISIAGISANKIEWSGDLEEKKMKGVFYTLIFHGHLYAINLQDILPYAENNLPNMIKTIETLKQNG